MGLFRNWKTWALAGLCALVVAQFVRPSLVNPTLDAEPKWDSPRTRELVRRACFDCHSNRTSYPWYSQVEPARWFLWDHIRGARKHLNFSDPDSDLDVDDLVDAIRSGDMPLWSYRLLHPAARLTGPEKDSLVVGLLRTFENDSDSATDSVSQTPPADTEAAKNRSPIEDRD
ncbi:MAG TPA: heme-binding domain-containing protein [Fibrobacteria bacterium]|nr:heme-binding domain-containing protein [Fibrobacteria bacterium]